MAGLIQEQMAPQEQMPAAEQGMMPPEEMPPEEQMEADAPADVENPDDDPGYAQAMAFAMEALYRQKAAREIATALRSTPNKVEALANTAYEIISIVDERTDGAIPDELLALFATKILEEVAEIGEAAGLDIKPSEIALALKQMILRFLGEQGIDASQLQQAMDQVDPEEFNRMAESEAA